MIFVYILQDHRKMKNVFVEEINWAQRKDKTVDNYVIFICDIWIPKLTKNWFINIL